MSFSLFRTRRIVGGVQVSMLTPVLLCSLLARPLAAQTGYYNTDVGRPVRIEDAYAGERFALNLYLAPLTIARRDDRLEFAASPEMSYGLLPRTEVRLGLPLALREVDGRRQMGVSGIKVATLYNFNAETRVWPALAMRTAAIVPLGRFAPPGFYPSLQANATRSFRAMRLHANVAYTFGDEPPAGAGTSDVMRWVTGVAIDRTFPLRSLLVTADLFREQQLSADQAPDWTAGAGFRYQMSPVYGVDAGLSRTFNGARAGWSATFGFAHASGIRVLPWGVGRRGVR